jgi:hypothetical protein
VANLHSRAVAVVGRRGGDGSGSSVYLHLGGHGCEVGSEFIFQVACIIKVHFVERHHMGLATIGRVVQPQLLSHHPVVSNRVLCTTKKLLGFRVPDVTRSTATGPSAAERTQLARVLM